MCCDIVAPMIGVTPDTRSPETTDGCSRLILASGSPRRRQMLGLIGLEFEIHVPEVDESPNDGENPVDYARRTATLKALAVSEIRPELPVLAADTVVALEDQILGKPESEADAIRMLELLAGRTHQVHTAMSLAHGNRHETIVDSTQVRFLPMSQRDISWYVATGEPMDKAGAYGVQGIGGLFVAEVDGSPHTVVGLPIHRLDELFGLLGLALWDVLD